MTPVLAIQATTDRMVKPAGVTGRATGESCESNHKAFQLLDVEFLPAQPFWIQSRMAGSPSAHRIQVDAQSILFCERAQQLFQLNPTAARIWDRLTEGWSCQSIAEDFEREGLPLSDAFNFVRGIVEKWLVAGHVIPADIVSATANRPRERRRLSVGDTSLQVNFFGNADLPVFDRVFGHLQADGEPPRRRLDVVECSGAYFLVRDSEPWGMASPSKIIPLLKALLTEGCCEDTENGFLAHGALVSREGRRILVTGPPGAGKTTLAIALLSSGFSFGGDDIVHIGPTGQALGLPFAAAVKSGSWDLLASLYPELSAADVHERADGQFVRYVVPERRDTPEARELDVVVVLARDAESPAGAEPLPPLDALCEILKSGYSPHRRADAQTVRALAESLSRGSCYRLVYSDLAGAVSAFDELI
jgi:hypothetical protein